MLESAKRHLESNEGFDVLGGFLSPSSDVYVSGKCNKKHLHVREERILCTIRPVCLIHFARL